MFGEISENQVGSQQFLDDRRRVVNGRSAVERQSHRKGGATAGWAVEDEETAERVDAILESHDA